MRRAFDPSLFSHCAAGLNARGVGVALAGYNLCPQATIAQIIDEARRAALALWRRCHQRMLVFGHSAGGHLTAALLATDWPALDPTAPADMVAAGYAISGLFDLAPLMHVSVNEDLRLDADSARKTSPAMWPAPQGRVFDAVVGATTPRCASAARKRNCQARAAASVGTRRVGPAQQPHRVDHEGEREPDAHGPATSQDILDTAAMLLSSRARELILADLDGVCAACAGLAQTHRSTPMMARTLYRASSGRVKRSMRMLVVVPTDSGT